MSMRRIAVSVLLLAFVLGTASAGAEVEALPRAVAEHAPEAVEWRHHLHRNPELSNREEETAAFVAERLRELGLAVRTGIAHTGVLGVLRGGRPGPTVAVRADMDALPVTERSGLPFASTETTTFQGQEVGVAHACGHDVHTAVALGVAAVLVDRRAELPGTVLFVFQPAEEGAPAGEEGGAELMLADGVFSEHDPEAIFALHSWPDREVGQVEAAAGPTFAAVDKFRATLEGEQAHGAYPHQGIDPVVMASQAVMALQTIRSRNLDPRAASVVTVGIIRGGERFNIIPEEVRLEGTVRTYRPEVQDEIQARMDEVLAGIAASAGGSHTLDYERITPATVNDP
ncbi:MAG: amidohydrolase, partial [Thermoanaerobaculia bacterium]|nr:amidohydrolase [Thermoanaerobaculia bacterium]